MTAESEHQLQKHELAIIYQNKHNFEHASVLGNPEQCQYFQACYMYNKINVYCQENVF